MPDTGRGLSATNVYRGDHLKKVSEGFLDRDLRKQACTARNDVIKCIKESFSQLHRDVQTRCTTPETRNNEVLQRCYQVNIRERERCVLHIEKLFKALIEKVIRLPQELIQPEIKDYMSGFYDEVQLFFTDRRAIKSRGEKVPSGVTKIVQEKFEDFLKTEAASMLRHVTGALETALSTVITKTLHTALSTDGANKLDQAISRLQQSYAQGFQSGHRNGGVSSEDIVQLRAIYADVTKESAWLQEVSSQIESKPAPGLKREATMELSSVNKRGRGGSTNTRGASAEDPVEIEE